MAPAKLLKRSDQKTMFINPDHVVSIIDQERGSCTVTLSTGLSYIFTESAENATAILWEDRRVANADAA